MKIWTKVHLKDQNKTVELISKSLTNYLYSYGKILDIMKKYNVSDEDRLELDQELANRISGILLLYAAGDFDRINDIINKYNINNQRIKNILPELEGYIER